MSDAAADAAAPQGVIAGVDGCPGGWYVVQTAQDGPALQARVCRTFAEVLQWLPAPAVIAVDMPIGLAERSVRACDQAARQLLGPRRAASVFPAPLRGVLGAASHAEATARSRALDGKGMSIQAYNLLRKVEQVDAALRAAPQVAQRTFEVHPEVCFRQMNGGVALQHGKKTAHGRAERLALLEAPFAGQAPRLLGERVKSQVQADDVLDALATLWTARRLARGQAVALPASPGRDACGLTMAIHY